jgi:hypothetical protein
MLFAGSRADAYSTPETLNKRTGITMRTASWVKYDIFVLVLTVGFAAPAGATVPDAWITTKAKLALLTTEGVSGTQINVDTILGRVTLHGNMEDRQWRAESPIK